MLLGKLLAKLQSDIYTHVKMQPNAPLHVCTSKTTTIKVAASATANAATAAAAAAHQVHAQARPKPAATKDKGAHAQVRHVSYASNSADTMITASANAGQSV